jgi:anaerobic ribonucleoside-triphosphate reductase
LNIDFDKLKIIKKDGTIEKWNPEKIIIAVGKSAHRLSEKFSEDDNEKIIDIIKGRIEKFGKTEVTISEMHTYVEYALDIVNPSVAKSYKDFRNYKIEISELTDRVLNKANTIRYIGDRSNANKDAKLVATKRSLIYGEWATETFEKFFLTDEERQASRDGFLYFHDKDSRQDTINCCLCDVGSILKDGFEMGNMWYNEPNSLDTAFDILGDIILATAAQQYGGFTVPEVDSILEPYAQKSFNKFYDEKYDEIYKERIETMEWMMAHNGLYLVDSEQKLEDLKEEARKDAARKAREYAFRKIKRECEQGMQGIEYKLNTVGSSRGDYPFTTFTFGLNETPLGRMIAKTILRVRKEGQGKKGFKKPVLFPKLVFLYDENLHGVGKLCEDVFEEAIECSGKCMYPDYLSLTGEGYVASMYKKYKKAISPMGCRAFLSPWYERGGLEPADEDDKPVFIGRFNLGVVTLHLPMILQKSREENRNFFEVLEYYLEMIRDFHKRTIEYIGNLQASCNPVMFCEGGAYQGHLDPSDKIAPILKPQTVSFGITALNELQVLFNGKTIREDGTFALDVMKFINNKINAYKKADGILYAIYGTPAETLAGKQIQQFREKYGVIEGVSSREYTTNSFHCAVWEDITPIEKQDNEYRFWDYFNGGKIQYCKYPVQYNKEARRTLIRRAMKMGLYEGVNLSLSYCNTCGHEELEMEVCPHCGSSNITAINRMNGYLGFTRVGTVDGNKDYDSSPGKTSRYNAAKVAEIKERISM